MCSVKRRFRADTAEKMMPLGRISPLTTLPFLLPFFQERKGKSPLSVAQFPSPLPLPLLFPFLNRVLVVAFPLPLSPHSGFCEGSNMWSLWCSIHFGGPFYIIAFTICSQETQRGIQSPLAFMLGLFDRVLLRKISSPLLAPFHPFLPFS